MLVVDDIFADEGSPDCPSLHPAAPAAERAASAAMAAYSSEGPALAAPPPAQEEEEEFSLLPEWARGAVVRLLPCPRAGNPPPPLLLDFGLWV